MTSVAQEKPPMTPFGYSWLPRLITYSVGVVVKACFISAPAVPKVTVSRHVVPGPPPTLNVTTPPPTAPQARNVTVFAPGAPLTPGPVPQFEALPASQNTPPYA